MADPALHPIFQNACNAFKVKSPQIERMQQIIAELTSRYLLELKAAGTINDYHEKNEDRLRNVYNLPDYWQKNEGSTTSSVDSRAAFRRSENEYRESIGYQTATS